MATLATNGTFPYIIPPLTNISPFTYRDGGTYLEILYALRDYINNNLRGEFNDEMQRIIDDFNAGIVNMEAAHTAFVDLVTAQVDLINDKTGPMAVQHATLTSNAYVVAIDPLWPDNQPVTYDLLQDGTGGRTVTLGTGVTGPLDLNPAPNGRTVFTLFPVAGGTWRVGYNSWTDTVQAVAVAGKLDTATAATTYQTIANVTAALATAASTNAATYKTITSYDTERAADQAAIPATYLTKTSAAALYPTKQTVIDGRAPERRTAVRGGKTAFIGDSYVSGVGPSTQANRWTSRYAAYAGFIESNHAVSSSGYVNEGVGGASRFATQAGNIPTDATRVIVCGGINDTSFTATQIANGVTETIGAIRTRVPAAEIIVISPMWPNSQPSDGLLTTERLIRNNVPTDIRYIEGGPWLRQGRPDTANSSDGGHPTDVGSLLIARWVQAKIENTGPGGALEGSFERTALNEDELVTSSGSGIAVAGGTVYDARPGKWKLTQQLAAYQGPAGPSDGFLWNSIAGQRIVQRGGIVGTVPNFTEYVTEVRHPGGDMVIETGITMNGQIQLLKTGTRIKAKWIED